MKQEFVAFTLTVGTLAGLLSLVAVNLWQSVDAVYVVCEGMGVVTVLVLASCEIQDVPLLEE